MFATLKFVTIIFKKCLSHVSVDSLAKFVERKHKYRFQINNPKLTHSHCKLSQGNSVSYFVVRDYLHGCIYTFYVSVSQFVVLFFYCEFCTISLYIFAKQHWSLTQIDFECEKKEHIFLSTSSLNCNCVILAALFV